MQTATNNKEQHIESVNVLGVPSKRRSADIKLEDCETRTPNCRICLRIVAEQHLHPLTMGHESKLRAAFKQRINPEDSQRCICTNCSNLLDIFLNFQNAARKTYILLREGVKLSQCNDWSSPEYVQAIATCREVTDSHRKRIEAIYNQHPKLPDSSSHRNDDVLEEQDIKIEPICELTEETRGKCSIKEEAVGNVKNERLEDNDVGIRREGYSLSYSEDDIPLKRRKKGSNISKDNAYKLRRGRKPKDQPEFMPQLCDFCGKRVCGESAEGHKNQHLGIKPYPCTVPGCSLLFYGRYNRLRHVKRMHSESGVEVHNCHVCGKSIRGPTRALKYHLERHEQNQRNEKNFVCQVCGKGFTLQRYLAQHSIIHSGEFPHKCSYCGKKFNNKWGMRTHEKNIHEKKNKRTSEQEHDEGNKPKFCTTDNAGVG